MAEENKKGIAKLKSKSADYLDNMEMTRKQEMAKLLEEKESEAAKKKKKKKMYNGEEFAKRVQENNAVTEKFLKK